MTADMGLAIVGLLSVIVNYITLYIIFPCRHSRRLSITLTILFVATFYLVLIISGLVTTTFYGLRGFIHFPMIMFLFNGQFFQKTFATFFVMVLSGMQLYPAKAIAGLLAPADISEYYCLYIVVLSVMYLMYLFLMFKFGRSIFNKMFITGRRVEWGIYSLGAIFSLMIMAFLQSVSIPIWVNMILLVFILWSFCVLCFAIINTHEKSKQRYEAEFARNIISSGRDHYQKMDELYDRLRILRHDYKHHLNVTREMLDSGSLEEAEQYLNEVENQMPGVDLYCSNTVLNALIASYAERCEDLDILLDVKISIPEKLSVPNYDMCIILGNLLENAFEACEKHKSPRKAELVVKPHGTQLVIVAKNSFDGHIVPVDEMPVSIKKDGGLGLRSVQAVAARYGGELLTEWDANTFTAYVTVGL